MHRTFFNKKVNGEWFDLADDDIKSFSEKCKFTHDMLELITTENSYYLETGRLF